MDIANWIVAFGTAGGAIASSWAAWAALRGLNESKKYRMMSVKPILTVERTSPPDGQHATNNFANLSAANYYFTVRNVGPGPAVLGTDPFHTPYNQVTTRTLFRTPEVLGHLPDRMIYPQTPLPNVIPAGSISPLKLAMGYSSDKLMENPWEFELYYTDVNGSQLWTTISIDPHSGDVLKLELGPQEQSSPSFWRQILEESRQI